MGTEYSVYTVLQASRRSWRIGQTQPVKVYFYTYEETLQEDALSLIAAKVAATLRVNGDTVANDSLAELDSLASVQTLSPPWPASSPDRNSAVPPPSRTPSAKPTKNSAAPTPSSATMVEMVDMPVLNQETAVSQNGKPPPHPILIPLPLAPNAPRPLTAASSNETISAGVRPRQTSTETAVFANPKLHRPPTSYPYSVE